MKKRFSVPTLIAACLVSVALTGACIFGFIVLKCGGTDSLPYALKFSEVFHAIKNDFVGDANMDKVSDAAYGSMISEIDDKWSYYMNAEQYEEYKLYQKNSYTGIGVTIDKDEASGLYKIVIVAEDTPASAAGVQIGDLMLAIDGEDLTGKTSSEIKAMITDRKGKSFELKLKARMERREP